MQKTLAALSGILFLAAYVPYIRGILNGTQHPMKSSWFIWALLDSITFFGMLAQQAVNPQIAASVLGCWTVFLLTLKYGKPGLNRLDIVCLAGAALGIGLWIAFDSPRLGLAMSLAVTFLGSLPTFVSAWKEPRDESRPAWILFGLSSVCATIAIPAHTFKDAGQPLVFLLISAVMVAILFAPKRT